ncbi:hypothetical protein SEA_AMGINE_89 [Mycobacterium phage Amgine]|uniref:Uncharacterized protein n=1 Tax=Mycobacterium phage Amgine TaxID=2015817 RepID=A0A222ZMS6_9CAUD|nr:hypothetical protein I5G84_gp89 [Mycobacterium phage Amgine]ASR85689.1 hypothetical protein SEA_AMGINE_89 [Mycobacterium phage Amgine]
MTVGVVAQRLEIARTLIRRLGLQDARPFCARDLRVSCRGHTLDLVLIDEDAKLSPEALDTLQWALRPQGGEVFRLRRASLPPPF